MNHTLNHISAFLIVSILALTSTNTWADASVEKMTPSVKSKSQASGKDKLMTLDELRTCMKLRESNIASAYDIEKRNEQNHNEKQALLNASDGSKESRAEVDALLEAVKQADTLVREHGKAIEDWNERSVEFEKKAKDMRNERQRRQRLKDERIELKEVDEKLIADRTAKVALYERAVDEVNKKINQRSKLNEAWNKRNEQLADDQDKLVESRNKWTVECSRRRFLEEDEKAIKAGK